MASQIAILSAIDSVEVSNSYSSSQCTGSTKINNVFVAATRQDKELVTFSAYGRLGCVKEITVEKCEHFKYSHDADGNIVKEEKVGEELCCEEIPTEIALELLRKFTKLYI